MNLDKFAQLIACNSTNTAKNTLSYLIGNGQVNPDWDEALSNLYKSFPKELKETVKQKKEFLSVKGDGKKTLKDLVMENPRSAYQIKAVEQQMRNEMQKIIPENEVIILVPFGSHTRGANIVTGKR